MESRRMVLKNLFTGQQWENSRQIGSGQTGDGKSECQHSKNQQTKMNWNG